MATKALQQINGIALLDYTEGFIFRADDEDKAITRSWMHCSQLPPKAMLSGSCTC